MLVKTYGDNVENTKTSLAHYHTNARILLQSSVRFLNRAFSQTKK